MVQTGFRLACPDVIPLTICPGFYPSMVTITVSPARCVDLTGRYTDAAKSGHRQRGFFAASTTSIPDHRQR
ncbi:hypothetical protein D3C76_1435100 [compost metagenome]